MKKIPPFKYYFPPNTVKWIATKIQELLESNDFLTSGKYTEEFEKRFAEYIGSKNAVAVSSGTAALEIILRAIDIQNQEVILPTNTFAATAYAVIRAGGKPIFADIAEDMNIDPANVKNRLTVKTKVIISVHIGGLVSPSLSELLGFSSQQGIHVVEDAAHAHGSMLNGKKAGNFGIAGAFSFFSTKVITMGEGGIITTKDDEIAGKARLLRDQGKIRGNLVGVIGYNWRMTEFQAIVGLAQLRLLEEIIQKRNRIASVYDTLVKDIPLIQPLKTPQNIRHNYYKYILFLPKGREPEVLRKHLKEKYATSLGGYVYEVPLHKQPVFKEYVEDFNSYAIADDLCTRHIALPIYPQMTEEEAHYVINNLKLALKDLGWI